MMEENNLIIDTYTQDNTSSDTKPLPNKEPLIVRYAKDRVMNKNKNLFMLFVGATGSGKSYAALRLSELIDKSFTIDRVCFKAKDFMNTINQLVVRSEKGEEIKGLVVMWDEFGVEHNAREFMTISNRVINYFFQTSRHLNLIVIVTVPLLSFIDSATRKLSHVIAEMIGIDSHHKTSSVRIKMLQTNVMTGKEYPKYLRYRKNHRMLVSKKIKFKLPSKKLFEAYEKKKKVFTTQLNIEIMNKLLVNEVKENPIKPTKPLTALQERIMQCLKDGMTNQKEIANLLDKSAPQISINIKYLRNKGYVDGISIINDINPKNQHPQLNLVESETSG